MNLLCKIGIHRPLFNHKEFFVDKVSGNQIYDAECSCGKKFMVDSLLGYCGFKVEIKKNKR